MCLGGKSTQQRNGQDWGPCWVSCLQTGAQAASILTLPRFAGSSSDEMGRRLVGKESRELCPGLCVLRSTQPGLSHVGSEVDA